MNSQNNTYKIDINFVLVYYSTKRKMIEGSDKDKKRWKAEKQELEDSLERSRKRCNGFVAVAPPPVSRNSSNRVT